MPVDLQKNYKSNITRKEFCSLTIEFIRQILYFAGEEPDDILGLESGESPFTDVNDMAVTTAYHLGIVSGIGGGLFNPYGEITRQEAAVMLTNLAKAFLDDVSAKPSSFSDAGDIAGWAKASVDYVYERGIMSGTGNNKFSPKAQYTREQSIVTVVRTLDVLLE